MPKYVKASDGFINVVSPEGFPKTVTQRSYDVVYKGRGYKLASEVKVDTVRTEDYSTYSKSKLKKVENDDLKAYLDAQDIKYPTDAIKEDLINAILGE